MAEKSLLDELDLQFQEKADPKMLEIMSKLGSALAMIYKQVSRPLILPKIFKIQGQVEVTKQASVNVKNLDELGAFFKSLEQKLALLSNAVSSAPPPVVNIPKFEMPKMSAASGVDPKLIDLLESLEEKIDKLQPQEMKFPKKISVDNFPVTLTPQPVTNININPLQGVIKTSSTTVGTALTTLPGYGQLPNRRSLVIYNNSANVIYVGGSDVTASNGIPVAGGDFSNVFDAGYNQIIYGIASTSGNDIRVLESATRSEPYISDQA